MNNFPSDMPAGQVSLFQLGWKPGLGLEPWCIRACLDCLGVSRDQVALDAGVTPHYVDHVITRIRRSAQVEGLISRCLGQMGLTPEHIWGSKPARGVRVGPAIPACLADLPRFTGRFLPSRHAMGLVLDCETTGFSPAKHAVIEIGVASFVYTRPEFGVPRVLGVLKAYTGLQDPGEAAVNPIAMRANRISLADLRERRFDRQRLRGVVSKAEVVIAHNAAFDFAFTTKEFPGLAALPWFCSLRQVPWRNLGQPSAALGKLCKAYGVTPPSHRALQDCRALLELLSRKVRGEETLLALLLAQRPKFAPGAGSSPT